MALDRRAQQRKYLAITLLLLTILSLVAITAGGRRLSAMESAAVETLAVFQKPVQTAGAFFGRWLSTLREFRGLAAENGRLRSELEGLSRKYSGLVEQAIENERLRQLLDFKLSSPAGVVAASVIGRSSSQWYNTLQIDRGSADGVSKDMPVVTGQGLVGKVLATTSHTATVLLLLDPDCGAGAMVQRTRDFGVVLGQFGPGGLLEMRLFARDASAAVGDLVLTSGLGDIFPPDLPIGVIAAVEWKEYGLTAYASIQPLVDFDRLEEVLVVQDTGTEVGDGA